MNKLFIVVLITLIALALSAPEDYVEPSIEDEEEIIVRSDGTSLKELPKLQPRPPFTLHDYSPKHAWITPLDEYSTFSSLLETAYERAKVEYPDGEGRMRAEGVSYMWEYVLNPDYGEIDEEEMDIIDESVLSFRTSESLLSDSLPLNLGYLNKGTPYRTLLNLFHTLRSRRRNQQGRRRMTSDDPSRDGLWEHEVEVDVPKQIKKGEKRRMLEFMD
ncbi:hypothetical protein TrVE_jg8536 [Triparma verrucosa]|uniref:Uncharacterized protein n=1 Tax=Triparma verrucosa TaxID=1606542 RepID=A0A9W7KU27_9STRA|nr:hypothetical protein TrVE_jg8536 [Triparma verrucosa]